MANVYVRSGAGGAATGADWANAYLTLAAAFAAKAAGDTFWVSEDHAETQATALTATCPGTLANPCFVYCVNHSGSVPPVSADLRTTATITTTGNSSITIDGSAAFNGITLNNGSGANGPNLSLAAGGSVFQRWDNSAFNLVGTAAAGSILSGAAPTTRMVWNNTTVSFGNAAQNILFRGGNTLWSNTPSALGGGAIPTTLMFAASNQSSTLAVLDGVDLSAAGVGKTILSAWSGNYLLNNCKLGASVTVAGNNSALGAIADVVRCDSGATNYRNERYAYNGAQTTETTIVRTGGASDGTTPISWKFVSTANSKWVSPFESQPIAIWNDSTSAITTLTIYGTTTGGGVPNNDDIWVEVEYLGSSLTPQGSFKTTTKADNLAASATTNNSADASVWGGGGAGNGFKIVVPSFTPGMKGPISVTVKVAKASSTYYIDPKPVVN